MIAMVFNYLNQTFHRVLVVLCGNCGGGGVVVVVGVILVIAPGQQGNCAKSLLL